MDAKERIDLGLPGHSYDKLIDKHGNWVGINEWHPCIVDGVDKDEECGGFVCFDTPEAREVTTEASPKWQVQSWEPLTIHPSLLCRACGNHGWIRNGVWESA